MSQSTRQLEAIIMAAGKGTRMGSDLPKVLHPVADRSMVHWVLDACEQAGSVRNVVIIGHGADLVRRELAGRSNVVFVEQTQQLGTGHAVMQAGPVFTGKTAGVDVLVLAGDGPLIQPKTIHKLIDTHRRSRAAATLATAVLPDPKGYGRIVRDSSGNFRGIVEQKDATPEQLAIREVNPSYYCFRADDLFDALSKIDNKNKAGEFYLTDTLGVLVRGGKKVEVVDAVPPEDVLSINTPQELAVVDGILRNRLSAGMEAGR
jgi:bifunctional UDP-N-acetylglucosamine pyrophosphorylase/glucosamine-1-phosphate N-acetyltransferase